LSSGLLSGVLQTQYYPGDQIWKNEMMGHAALYGGGKRCIEGFGEET